MSPGGRRRLAAAAALLLAGLLVGAASGNPSGGLVGLGVALGLIGLIEFSR